MNGSPMVKPTWWFYVLGGMVILTGVSYFAYALFHGITHITDNVTQIVVPGEKDLTLMAKLEYTIFLEEQSVVDGRIYSTSREDLEGLTCSVTSRTTGKKIDTQRARMSTTYTVGGRSGRSVLAFITEEAGIYRVTCDYSEGKQGPAAVLAVGSGVTEGIFKLVFQSVATMFGGGALGIVIILVVFFQRERSKKRLMAIGQPVV
jgi:hypothetical protein